MKSVLLVGLGGFTGTICRYLIYLWVDKTYQNPFLLGTLGVNLIGCFFIGIIFGFFIKYEGLNDTWRIVFATGFCGGFTTFSAYAYESLQLLQEHHVITFLLYTFGSIALGLLMVWLGIILVR
jgi:CrcB protein